MEKRQPRKTREYHFQCQKVLAGGKRRFRLILDHDRDRPDFHEQCLKATRLRRVILNLLFGIQDQLIIFGHFDAQG